MTQSVWGGQGRPDTIESARRRRQFIRLLTNGHSWADAARTARVKPAAVLRMLDDPGFAQVAANLLHEHASKVAA